MYRAIRNPRSHEQVEDSKRAADAIIYFIDYLLGILAQSRPPFTMDDFLAKVFDPDFVQSPSYAELLVAEIPETKQLDVIIQIYRDRDSGDGKALGYIVKAVLDQLTETQIEDFFAVVSEELATTREDKTFRETLQMLPESFWPKVSKVARIRAENKLLNSMRQGAYDRYANRTKSGALGTWARDFIEYFDSRGQVTSVLISKLDADFEERSYVTKYFIGTLPNLQMSSWQRSSCIKAICSAVIAGEEPTIEALQNMFWYLPNDWHDELKQGLEELQESNPDLYEHFFGGVGEDALPF
jgi:hypothetical protein